MVVAILPVSFYALSLASRSGRLRAAAVIVISYLLGSIPFGYLIVRARRGADIRDTGSGGTGATNVSRRAGKGAGVLTLLLDALKGATAVTMARLILGLPLDGTIRYIHPILRTPGLSDVASPEDVYWWVATAAVAVIVGHIFPIWLGFLGGKGVATGGGAFLMLAPIAVAMAALVFVVIVALTRYVSLASILAAASIPLFVLLQQVFFGPVTFMKPIMSATIAGAALIVFAHRSNIERLVQGSESKFK